jgi:hypothetical protein
MRRDGDCFSTRGVEQSRGDANCDEQTAKKAENRGRYVGDETKQGSGHEALGVPVSTGRRVRSGACKAYRRWMPICRSLAGCSFT